MLESRADPSTNDDSCNPVEWCPSRGPLLPTTREYWARGLEFEAAYWQVICPNSGIRPGVKIWVRIRIDATLTGKGYPESQVSLCTIVPSTRHSAEHIRRKIRGVMEWVCGSQKTITAFSHVSERQLHRRQKLR